MSELELRKAEYADMEQIYKWANEEGTRRNSFNTSRISHDEHVRWFEAKLKDENTYIFVLMRDKEPVGQGRITVEGDIGMISYAIGQTYQGQGLGRALLTALVDECIHHIPCIIQIIGLVKVDNQASKRLFNSLGFNEEVTTHNGVEVLKYTLKLNKTS